MRSIDCTDIKVLLSGLVDDELDAETRHDAERHVAQCAECAKLIGRAEALDGMVAAEVDAWHPVDRLPDGFVGAVLSRTVFASRRTPFTERWTTWAGWMAAAAALVLAMTVWVMDRQARMPGGGERGMPAITATYRAGSELRSSTLVWPLDDEALGPTLGPPRISLDDSEALYTTSIVLAMLADTAAGDDAEIDRMRRIVAYDDLLGRLAEARQRVADGDRPAVLAAEGLLTRLAAGVPGEVDMRFLRETVIRLDLASAIEAMSEQGSDWPPA